MVILKIFCSGLNFGLENQQTRFSGKPHMNAALFSIKQECIPAGCVPSAAVAVFWGVTVATA